MITYYDLVMNMEFREFVCNRIKSYTEEYSLDMPFPKLFKYRALSDYTIDDIINGKSTMSSIGEFNDAFDGSIHMNRTREMYLAEANKRWDTINSLWEEMKLPKGLIHKEDVVKESYSRADVKIRSKFRLLDYLGTYVGCYSESNVSSLMWAHYADSNRGICLEYDFNKLPVDCWLKSIIFPVVYTSSPIYLEDLIKDTTYEIYDYSIDAAVLCAAINKSSVWSYEHEWRMIWVMPPVEKERRIRINQQINPSKVYLGYHFLKSFFYYDKEENDKKKVLEKNIADFNKLLDYLYHNSIPIAVMRPVVGSYDFAPYDISVKYLNSFMHTKFRDNKPQDMRFYYVIHDMLMNKISANANNN